MAGFDLANTIYGVVPTAGASVQAGEFTADGDATAVFVPTNFSHVVYGVAAGDITDPCSGYAVSLCEGPTIAFQMSDATITGITYVAFGW